MGNRDDDASGQFASPPCFMHELDPASAEPDPQAAGDVARWRKTERARLIAERLAVPAETRTTMSEEIARGLDDLVADFSGKTVGVYWPFRGEPDLRPWIADVVRRGGRAALPVVVEKGQPLVFRRWAPGEKLVRGVWNIPIPAAGEAVSPDIIVSPLVGFDPKRFRLGYGGGFYDRTLAAMPRKPLVIGVGYEAGRLATIYPQWHDVPMDELIIAGHPG